MGGSFIIVVSLCATDFTMVYVTPRPARKIGGVHAGGRCHHDDVGAAPHLPDACRPLSINGLVRIVRTNPRSVTESSYGDVFFFTYISTSWYHVCKFVCLYVCPTF
jgi:hypothetical protein